ncbi:MAG: hypothetical protein RBS49_00145 [Sphaerochaeta sp.]|jgi:hypothetical protein|nr:hypothetical protein [Sphaerochaeta sp.]
MNKRTQAHTFLVATLLLLFIALSGLAAAVSTLPFNQIRVVGQMPITEIFRVDQNEQALDFNLVESRNSIVQVGSYTLISNNVSGQFKLTIKPGELGDLDQFIFSLDQGEPLIDGQLSELPFSIRVTSETSRTSSVGGSRAMVKDLGVRGGYSNNSAILYESGEILAEIPDFNPDRYATGRYSAALQLSIEVL